MFESVYLFAFETLSEHCTALTILQIFALLFIMFTLYGLLTTPRTVSKKPPTIIPNQSVN